MAVLIDGAAYFGAVRAAALKARRSISIMGWDLDSRMRLVGESGEPDDEYPAELAPFLSELVKQRPQLRVHLLLWDFSILYAQEREPFPEFTLHWRTPKGIKFCLDNHVPPGCSQHQKIVVIDDCLAFSGGLDLTSNRWDTTLHDVHNPKRIRPDGKLYRPFHDVQAMVDGEAAGAIAEIFRARWADVTGEKLVPGPADHDVWPSRITPHLKDIEVGISRTQPPYAGCAPVKEVEALFLDAIDQAQRTIYIENQFFTAQPVANRLAEKLRQTPELEVLLVGPQTYDSWIEARTMRNGRIRFMRTFAEKGVADRIRLMHPHIVAEDGSTDTMVHSKVMIVDDTFLRVGSANVNNRSMGTDTECDISVEARSDADRQAIARVRARLLADHCGSTAEEVLQRLQGGMSLFALAQTLSDRGHSLQPVDDGTPDPEEISRTIESLADPEKPIAPAPLTLLEFHGRGVSLPLVNTLKITAIVLVVIALTLAWQFTSLGDSLEPRKVEAWLASLSNDPWAPAYVLGAFLAGGLVAFPVTLLMAGTAAAFGPALGFAYAGIGALASAALTYGIGFWLGRQPLQNVLGPKLTRVRNAVVRSGVVAVAAVRLVPLAPFTIVNLVAGASRIALSDYLIGTALGLLPGLIAMSTLGHQLLRAIVDPNATDLAMLGGALVLWMALVVGAQAAVKRLSGGSR